MDAEHLALDNGSNPEIIEDFGAVFPRVGIAILSDGLIVEAVDSGDLPSLVVASEEGDMSWVLHLEAEEQLESFDGIETSIDKITHEDVSGVWNFTAFVEQFQQIVELAMDITTDSDWSLNWLNIALLNQNLFDFFAKDA